MPSPGDTGRDYGDEEKITEEDFALAKALDHKKLKVAYAG